MVILLILFNNGVLGFWGFGVLGCSSRSGWDLSIKRKPHSGNQHSASEAVIQNSIATPRPLSHTAQVLGGIRLI